MPDLLVEIVCDSKVSQTHKPDSTAMLTEGSQNDSVMELHAQLKGDIVSEVFKFFLFIRSGRNNENQNELIMLEEASVHFIYQFVKVIYEHGRN